MSNGLENVVGGEKQYVDSAMCNQKHGEVLRVLGDHKALLVEIKQIVNPRVINNENGVKANRRAIKELKRCKSRGVDVLFKVVQAIGAVGLIILTLLLVLKRV